VGISSFGWHEFIDHKNGMGAIPMGSKNKALEMFMQILNEQSYRCKETWKVR